MGQPIGMTGGRRRGGEGKISGGRRCNGYHVPTFARIEHRARSQGGAVPPFPLPVILDGAADPGQAQAPLSVAVHARHLCAALRWSI